MVCTLRQKRPRVLAGDDVLWSLCVVALADPGLRDLGLRALGRAGWAVEYKSQAGGRFLSMPSPHRHPEIEANLVLSGRASYLIGGRRVDLVRDALIWLWPSQPHLLVDQSPDFSMWIMVWRPSLIRRAAGRDAEAQALRRGCDGTPSKSTLMPRQLPEEDTLRLIDLMQRLADPNLPPGAEAAGLGWLVRECWSAFHDAADRPTGTRLHPAVDQAARWLAEHAAEDGAGDIDALADLCGLSRGRLSRLFTAQIGQTIVSYRQKCRLDIAMRLIGRGGRDGTPGRMNLLEAALSAGFGSYSQFYRAHVRHRGVPPAEGRRQ